MKAAMIAIDGPANASTSVAQITFSWRPYSAAATRMAAVPRKTNSTAHPRSSWSHATEAIVATSSDTLSAAASKPERRRSRKAAAMTAASKAETRRMRYPLCCEMEASGPPSSSVCN